MATFPIKSTRWADTGSADIVDPPSGKRDIGWIDAEEPAAEYFNHWMLAVHEYVEFFKTNAVQRDGSIAMTGDLVPDATGNNRKIGTTGARFDANLDTVTLNSLAGNLSPDTTGSRTLGTVSLRWLNAFLNEANVAGDVTATKVYADDIDVTDDLTVGDNLIVSGTIVNPQVPRIYGRIPVVAGDSTPNATLDTGSIGWTPNVTSATEVELTVVGYDLTKFVWSVNAYSPTFGALLAAVVSVDATHVKFIFDADSAPLNMLTTHDVNIFFMGIQTA